MDVSEKCELCKMQVKFWKGSDNYIDKEISRCNNIFGTREIFTSGPEVYLLLPVGHRMLL